MASFDPNQPFEVVKKESVKAAKFDPSQPFDVEEPKPEQMQKQEVYERFGSSATPEDEKVAGEFVDKIGTTTPEDVAEYLEYVAKGAIDAPSKVVRGILSATSPKAKDALEKLMSLYTPKQRTAMAIGGTLPDAAYSLLPGYIPAQVYGRLAPDIDKDGLIETIKNNKVDTLATALSTVAHVPNMISGASKLTSAVANKIPYGTKSLDVVKNTLKAGASKLSPGNLRDKASRSMAKMMGLGDELAGTEGQAAKAMEQGKIASESIPPLRKTVRGVLKGVKKQGTKNKKQLTKGYKAIDDVADGRTVVHKNALAAKIREKAAKSGAAGEFEVAKESEAIAKNVETMLRPEASATESWETMQIFGKRGYKDDGGISKAAYAEARTALKETVTESAAKFKGSGKAISNLNKSNEEASKVLKTINTLKPLAEKSSAAPTGTEITMALFSPFVPWAAKATMLKYAARIGGMVARPIGASATRGVANVVEKAAKASKFLKEPINASREVIKPTSAITAQFGGLRE